MAVKNMLKEVANEVQVSTRMCVANLNVSKICCSLYKLDGSPIAVLSAEDKMDDGTDIKVKVSISKEDGTASVDFTGTGPQVVVVSCFYCSEEGIEGVSVDGRELVKSPFLDIIINSLSL